MAQILVRNLDRNTIARLKLLAKRHGRSLQGEVKVILGEAITLSISESRILSKQWQKRSGSRVLSNSADLIREDRNR
jgi:antitoxin FitA